MRLVCDCCKSTYSIPTKVRVRMVELGLDTPKHCYDCLQLKKESRTLICTACAEPFELTLLVETKLRNYFGKKYTDPRYCLDCRKLWKGDSS